MRTDIIDNLKLEIDGFIASEELKKEVRDQVADAFKTLIADKEKKKHEAADKKDPDKKRENKEAKLQDSKQGIKSIIQGDILKLESTTNHPKKAKLLQHPKKVNNLQKDIKSELIPPKKQEANSNTVETMSSDKPKLEKLINESNNSETNITEKKKEKPRLQRY